MANLSANQAWRLSSRAADKQPRPMSQVHFAAMPSDVEVRQFWIPDCSIEQVFDRK